MRSLALATLFAALSQAAVTRVEITQRADAPIPGFERISGRIHFAVDPKLASDDDEVDTLGGLVFLLAGRIPAKGESVLHSSGWRLEAVDSDPRRIVRVRLHAPETASSEPAPEK